MQEHLTEEDLVLHYYGDMGDAEEARATAHLAACAPCEAQYRGLQRVLAAVEQTAFAAPDLPPHFERTVWARLEPNLRQGRGSWLAWLVFSPARAAWAAGIVLLVAASFLAGRLAPREGPSTAVTPAADRGSVSDRVLLIDLGDHLDRSQMVLLELASGGGSEAEVDFASERARVEQLLAANRLYRQTASTSGNVNIAEFLDDLELLLIDLAASPEHPSAQDLDDVRRRIESKGLLFKARVLSSEIRERQKAAFQRRAGQRSSL